MIPHPSQPLITRIMTPSEHCNLRGVTGDYKKNVLAIESGTHYSQSSNRGSATEAHKMLGNSCSPKPWFSLGCRIGEWLKGGKPQSDIAETARPAPIAAHVDPDDQFAFNF